ncbi:HsdS Restriction endonuclease S subunits [Comamonadaceae bacterium]
MSRKDSQLFHETKVGPIPQDWKCLEFGELLREPPTYGANASAEPFQDGGIRYIRITDITEDSKLKSSGKKSLPTDVGEKYILSDGDILLARSGSVGRSLVYRSTHGLAAFAGYLLRFRLGERASVDFVSQYLHSDAYWTWVNGAAKIGAQPNINAEQYKSLPIPIPPLQEQKDISAILTAVNDKVDVIARQIETTQALKRGLLQTLLSRGVGIQEASGRWVPHKEFKLLSSQSFPAIWNSRRLGDIAPLIRRPVEIHPDSLYPELGLRSYGKGTFHKPALLGSEVGNKRLFQIRAGDLLFSNVFAWEGAVAVAKPEDDGRYGSHRYITCAVDATYADTTFLFRYLTTPVGITSLTLASPGGAGRNKTLGLGALADITVPIPPLEEQRKISQILDEVDAKLFALDSRRSACEALKRGLMHKLFTGEWRVRFDTSAAMT